MVIGTPGGSRIITVVVHCILNVIGYGMNIKEAIDAPRSDLFLLHDCRKAIQSGQIATWGAGHQRGVFAPSVERRVRARADTRSERRLRAQ